MPPRCRGDGGCPSPAPLGLTAVAASRLRSAPVPRSLGALKPETAAASARTLRPGAAGRSRSLSRSAPPPVPAPAASAGAASRTVSRGRGEDAVGLSQREARAGGGEPSSPSPPPPPPTPSRVAPRRPPAFVPLWGLPAALATRPPQPLLLPCPPPFLLPSLRTHLGALHPEMRRCRTSAVAYFPSNYLSSVLTPLPSPYTWAWHLAASLGFPRERVTRERMRRDLGSRAFCLCKPWDPRVLTHMLLLWLV